MTGKNPIAALAARQHGNVTRAQLLALGLGEGAIESRLRTGELHRAHAGVYGVGRPATTALERAAAAILACGENSALSHGSALSLYGFNRWWDFPLHVSSPSERRRPGIVTHRAALAPQDVRLQLGIRVTSPARTLLDCAPDLPTRRLVRIAADGRRSGLLREHAMDDVLRRFSRHPGVKLVRPLLDGQQLQTRSDFELDFLAFCRRHGIPEPRINARLDGREVDALFEDQKLIVECDGWDFHRDRHTFESDRERDAEALAAGYSTLRITWERLITAPEREAARLRGILRRPSEPGR